MGASNTFTTERVNRPLYLEPLCLLALVLVGTLVVTYLWTGYLGSDDQFYARAALDWLHHFPSLGNTHWALRYVPVLPIAASMGILGPSVFSLALPNVLFFVGFLLAHYGFLRQTFGWLTAVIGTCILITLPAFVELATYANPDLPEAAAAVISFWTFLNIDRSRRPNLAAIMAGAFAGLAFLARETMISLLLTYALMFIFRPLVPRRLYFAMAIGFTFVVGPEIIWFTARTGNPLYRTMISSQLSSGGETRAGAVAEAQAQGNAFDAEGILVVSPALAPLSAVLASPKFGLLFLLGIPSAIWLLWGRGELESRQRRNAVLFGLLALTSFSFIALNVTSLVVASRYFVLAAVAISVPFSVCASQLLANGRRAAFFGALLYISVSTAVICMLNRAPLWPENTLVTLASRSDEVIFTDPRTADRSTFLLALGGLLGRVEDAPPPAGALFLAREGVIERCLGQAICPWKDRASAYRVKAGWQVLDHFPAPRRLIGGIVRFLHLELVLPKDVTRKLSNPSDDLVLYRVRD